MRLLETLLSLANLLTFLVLVVPLPRAASWMRHLAPMALAIAIAQVLVEGPRWQMVPAYALAGLFFLIWLLQNFAPAGWPAGQKWTNRLAVGLGVLGLVFSIVLPIVLPVFRFPAPSGPYEIGTLTYHWVDAARPAVSTPDLDDRRQMNTFLVEELVSHGYVVVAIDQPYTATDVVFPDGRQAEGLPFEQTKPLARQSFLPAERAPTLNGRTFQEGIVPYLAQDVSFALDRLAVLNQADPNGILSGRLDLQRAGIFGPSGGGLVGGEACRLETRRLRACLFLDAPM